MQQQTVAAASLIWALSSSITVLTCNLRLPPLLCLKNPQTAFFEKRQTGFKHAPKLGVEEEEGVVVASLAPWLMKSTGIFKRTTPLNFPLSGVPGR